MAEPIVVVGAGGFGRETIDVIIAVNAVADRPVWELQGVVDDGPSKLNLARLERRGVSYLGTTEEFPRGTPDAAYVVGIGAPAVRRRVAERLDALDLRAATLVHPEATIGSAVNLGEGTVICAGARLTTGIQVGRHVHVNPNATVGHDTLLGDFVSLNPGSSVSGDCVLEDGVLVGVAGVVLNQLRVGSWATVGGGACVVRDVASSTVVKGVPAR